MPLPKNKIKKITKINLDAEKFGKPSPHVVDLRKILIEKSEADTAERSKQCQERVKKIICEKKVYNLPKPSPRLISGFVFSTIGVPGKIIKYSVAAAGDFGLFLKNIFLKFGNFFVRFFNFFRQSAADYKKILSFGLAAFIFILPLQAFSYFSNLKTTEKKILSEAGKAYESVLSASEKFYDSDFLAAADSFDQAAEEFGLAYDEIKNINLAIASLLKVLPAGGDKFKTGEAIIFAGEKLSWAGGKIFMSLGDFSAEGDQRKLTQKIKILRNDLAEVLPEVAVAAERIAGLRIDAVPEDKQQLLAALQNKLPEIARGLKKIISISDLMVKFLGDESDRRYLFVFQNSSELRPTGGFMGSLALVDLYRGEVLNMEVPGGGPYDFKGSLKERIAAPDALQLINARWELQDANWFPDFPSSAKKIKWFYEKSGGPTVDGVVAINSDFVSELLGVVGPIDMPEYGKTMSQENFIEEMQKAVEIEYDRKENQPKKIISDMMPKLIQKIMESDAAGAGKILAVSARALQEKNIIIYSIFPQVQHEILKLGWGGEVKNAGELSDYLSVIHSNLGGEKTDKVISEKIEIETTIREDGGIKNKLTIVKKHHGVKGEIFTGVRNVDYMRIYVPRGSNLIYAEGFESPPENLFKKPESNYLVDTDLKNYEGRVVIDAASGTRITSEFDKTVFGNWVQVDPGEEVTITVEYVLPFKIIFEKKEKDWFDSLRGWLGRQDKEKAFYQLLVQKQPGTKANFKSHVIFPSSWQPAWFYGEGATVRSSSVDLEISLISDRVYSIGFIKL